MTSDKKRNLCIHGHFYQPPRENPWIEEIELQESAFPFHDWNERICTECYASNTLARVTDSHGRIADIVNNFELMSFNFGPTLFSWLAKTHKNVYRLVLDADKKSRKRHGGHGNALAQVYNHMIMPLANRRDKETQVLWGIEDFKFHFGREPEGMWLPETACNEETLEVLVEQKIRFVILEPHQAEKVRPLGDQGRLPGEEGWQDVSAGQIDPKKAYRCFLKRFPDRFIDVFFYDGPISRAVGFEDLLFDSKKFIAKINGVGVPGGDETALIHIATDGETYGHHKPFGERVFAYLMNAEAPLHGYHFMNYGEFLEKNPPRNEVRLKEGKNGEGTSWSCPHGVDRWREHCGCRGGGPAEWHQHWRKPLREAFDWLRDELWKVYEYLGQEYFRDVAVARNAYAAVILDRSEEHARVFFEKQAHHEMKPEEKVRALKLLEMQRNGMLMYTSCGWFFTELSGIETVQTITYAARAIELAAEVTGTSLENEFLNRLELAKSNVPRYGDGRGVYEKLVRPKVMDWDHLVNYFAIMVLLDDKRSALKTHDLYCYTLHVLSARKENFSDIKLHTGRVRLRSQITFEEREFAYAAVQLGPYDFRCSIISDRGIKEFQAVEKELFEMLYSSHIVEIMRRIDEIFGERYYALKDLPVEPRLKTVAVLAEDMIEKITGMYHDLYEDSRRMNEIYRSLNLKIPEPLQEATAHILEIKLMEALRELEAVNFDLKKSAPVERILAEAKAFEFEIDKKEAAAFLSRALHFSTKRLMESAHPELIRQATNLVRLARRMGIFLNLTEAQNHLFFYLKKLKADPEKIPEELARHAGAFTILLKDLYINPHYFLDALQKKVPPEPSSPQPNT
ncbi:MAG: DUF3536 domain-containing protein [Candidatus Omnitrophota bacterium]